MTDTATASPPAVLLVDDDADARASLGWLLQYHGFQVLEAGTAREAIGLAAGADLVVLDVRLPDGDGFEVCRRIKARPGAPQVLMVSGYAVGSGDKVHGLEEGADAYLTKPVEPPVLLAQARALLRVRSAEERYRRSEGRLRAVVESSAAAIVTTTPGWVVETWNPAAEQLFGYTAPDMVGRSVLALVPPDLHDEALGLVERVRAGGRVDPYETVRLRKDGSEVPVSVNLWPVRDEAGRFVALAAIYTDLTDRRRGETELRRARAEIDRGLARMRAVVETMADGVVVAAPDGNLLDWNPAALRMHGFASLDEVRRHLSEFADIFVLSRPGGPHLPVAEWPMARVLRGETFADEEYHVRRPDAGLDLLLSYSGAAVRGPDGAVELAVLTIHDATRRRQAEAERDALLARLRLHVERMPLAYVRFDADLRVADWNPAAERIFGFTRDEVVGRGPPFDWLVPDSSRERIEGVLGRIRAGAMDAHSVNENRTKDGRVITCEWFNTPVQAPDGRFVGLLCLAQDVTDRLRLEEQYRQAQKLEAVGRLAGGVAHDFNNLLTVINGYAEVLLAGLPAAAPAREVLEEIRKAGERSAALTRQLLTFSRRAVVAPRDVDVNALVADLGQLLRRLIGEDIDLATRLDPAAGRVRIDPGQLEQVLVNLVVNARDAMPTGGKMTIGTAGVVLGEDYARGRVGVRPGPYVLVSVSDTGGGIPPDVLPHVFEPFFTTKEPGKGTGLGLATVHGIVQQAGGHVGVYSEVGVGTTFKVYLPRLDGPAEVRGEPPDSRLLVRGTETVLLVEDEDAVRALGRFVLRQAGYAVLEAATGEDALAAAAGYTGPVHLLVTDVVMPGVGGRELAEQIRGLRPGVRVLFTSGYTDDAVVRHGVLSDEVDFLQKPFTPAALTRKVRDILDGAR